MNRIKCSIIGCLFLQISFAQNPVGKFIADAKTGCKVWAANYNPKDSVQINWQGSCKNNLADGNGTLNWLIHGKVMANYTGVMKDGNPNGQGVYHYQDGTSVSGNYINGVLNGQGQILFADKTRKLEGNFVDGEILDLTSTYLPHLQKNMISETDTASLYFNNGKTHGLFYHILLPQKTIKGVLVLIAGTWDRTEYILSSNKSLVQQAFDNGIAVIVPSVNQRLSLNETVLGFLNSVFKDAINKYNLPKNKFVIGGFSMGGLFSLRYAEMAKADSGKTIVVPTAVYSVDGPTDLENAYFLQERLFARNPKADEPKYAVNEFKKYFGGPPTNFHDAYVYYSTYSRTENDGGNAKFLKDMPVRIYNDVDVNWWLNNRGEDLYDMNALDQSALINFLHRIGNNRAEFINAFGKGYRLEGNRHPHSWSIVDAKDCLEWIKHCVE